MVSIFIDGKLTRFQSEIKYAFSFILQTLGYSYCFISDTGRLNKNDILLIYGYNEPTPEDLKSIALHYITIYIKCDPDLYDPKAFSPDKLRKSISEIKLLSMTPVISTRKFQYPAENYSESNVHAGMINFDLVGNVFFHLAGLEERIEIRQDSNTACLDSTSCFYPYREMPYVDNLLWLLDSLIKEHTHAKGVYIVQKHYWPEAQQCAATLSHSVDNLRKWDYASLFLSVASDLGMFFTFNWRQLWHTISGKLKFLFTNYELYWNFDEFRELEKDSQCRSGWFIAPQQNEYINYSLDDPDLQEEISQLLADGNEVGLLMTADKPKLDDYLTRKQIMLHQIHREQIGVRQLGYRTGGALRELYNKLSPQYSQSTAWDEAPGYPFGFSVPYQPWIIGIKAAYWELPTVFRDSYLKVNAYKVLQLDDAKRTVKKFFQNTNRTRGIYGLDFSLASYTDVHYSKKLYTYLLALLRSGKTWITTAQELITWWEKRARVTIDESDYEISVYFPDDLEHMSLQILNEAKIREIEGVPALADNNLIRFSNVKAGSIAVIRLLKDQ